MKAGWFLGSDRNFAAERSAAPAGRAEGFGNLGSDPENARFRVSFSCCTSVLPAAFRCRSVAAAGDLLFFVSPKKPKEKKGEPKSGSLRDPLRCSRQAGSSSNSLRCTALRQSLALIRLPLCCSALPHGVWGMESGADSGIFGVGAQIRRAFVAPCGCYAETLRSDPKNHAARRVLKCFWPLAQVIRAQAAIVLVAAVRSEPIPESESDSGPPLQNPCECAEERKPRRIRARDCLSAASSSGTPAGLSTGRCPERSGGSQTPGSPFFSLGFFGETKKSKSPAAAIERHRNAAKNLSPDLKQGFESPRKEVSK
jgi:hypothetical protein